MDDWKDQWTNWIPVLEKELLDEMEKAPAVSEVHALDHILRVRERCERLGKELDADPEILVAAVYLHDLGQRAERRLCARWLLDEGVLSGRGSHGAQSAPVQSLPPLQTSVSR